MITEDFKNAVKNDDGTLANFTLNLDGKKYRCVCGCNVFHKPDKEKPEIYRCNSCGYTFETSKS